MGSLGPQKWTHEAGRLASRVVSLTGCRHALVLTQADWAGRPHRWVVLLPNRDATQALSIPVGQVLKILLVFKVNRGLIGESLDSFIFIIFFNLSGL